MFGDTGFFLDLRWNNIGFLGGRVLVNCFFSNRILWRLELVGNSVFGDIFRVVGMGISGCRWFVVFGVGYKVDFF